MEKVHISKISVDESGRVQVYPELPAGQDFALIYRSAMGVTWDNGRGCLLPRKVKSWGLFQWYKQIVAAVANEYGCRLFVSSRTHWSAIDKETRINIEAWQSEGAV